MLLSIFGWTVAFNSDGVLTSLLPLQGLTEKIIEGGLTGELFAHIIADQTERQKSGDRLYFEGRASQFTMGK